jgi:predicted nuclease of predicted toxin-antitoxin system
MRFLANENIPQDAVKLLRSNGYDVAWIRIDSPGVPDTEVLARARAEQRVLLTFDKGFGRLVFQLGHEASCGVVLFRTLAPSSLATARRILQALQERSDWAGHFSTVDDSGVRRTELRPKVP